MTKYQLLKQDFLKGVFMKRLNVGFIIFCFILSGCTNTEKDEQGTEKTPNGIQYVHQMVNNIAIEKQEDGWYYFISIEYKKIDEKSEKIVGNMDTIPNYVSFNGYNLKHKVMDNVYIPVIDKETGKEISQSKETMPALTTMQTVAKEAKGINDYLLEKKFSKSISLADLEDLNCPSFDKSLLVKLYNQALENTPKSFGRFALLPVRNMVQVRSDDGKTWQGAYFLGYGDISEIEFECIQDDAYVSDLVENHTASEKDVNLQENLDQLESYLKETQIFSLDGISWKHPEVMDDTVINAINGVLKKLYTGTKDV